MKFHPSTIARSVANEPLSAPEAARVFLDMANALAHLHSQSPPLAHRDVKPENYILSDADGRWRLCDFGSATAETFQYLDDGSMKAHHIATEEEHIHKTSTPQYRAPEMCDLRRGQPVGPKADVWALGVLLYELAALKLPFAGAKGP